MKKTLLATWLALAMVFCGANYAKSQDFEVPEHLRREVKSQKFEVPEHIKRYALSLYEDSRRWNEYDHVVVRISADKKLYMVTSRNGAHVRILAEKVGVEPIKHNRTYRHFDIAFTPNLKVSNFVEAIDWNKDDLITLDELSYHY